MSSWSILQGNDENSQIGPRADSSSKAHEPVVPRDAHNCNNGNTIRITVQNTRLVDKPIWNVGGENFSFL